MVAICMYLYTTRPMTLKFVTIHETTVDQKTLRPPISISLCISNAEWYLVQ